MQTLIHHSTIVTADDACTVYSDAAIVIEADRIAAIGPTDELLTRYPAAERIDGCGKPSCPAFQRSTHLHDGRGIYEDRRRRTPPFTGGLARCRPATERRGIPGDVPARVVEAIRSGTTLVWKTVLASSVMPRPWQRVVCVSSCASAPGTAHMPPSASLDPLRLTQHWPNRA